MTVFKELENPDLSERERDDKERKVERLRKQIKRELEPLEAFYKEFERQGQELERLLERKSQDEAEIKRLREELARMFQ